MMWLGDADVQAARSIRSALDRAQTPLEARRSALGELICLVASDVSSWTCIAVATGDVEREATPAAAEPRPIFEELVPTAARHPLLHLHAVRAQPAVRLSDVVEPRRLQRSELYDELLRRSGSEYGISIGVRPQPDEAVVFSLGRHERQFSERDRDLLDLASPAVEDALQAADARERLARALAEKAPTGTAVVLLDGYGEIEQSSPRADRWLAEHFGAAEHPAWLPEPVAAWLALPPRPPLHSVRGGLRLTVSLVAGDPHALLLEEDVGAFRPDALAWLGLTAREREVLQAARTIGDEGVIADELFLSLHAVREHLDRLEQRLGVSTAAEAVAAALRASV